MSRPQEALRKRQFSAIERMARCRGQFMISTDLMQAIKLSRCSTDPQWARDLIIDAAKREIQNGYTQQRIAAAALKAMPKREE